MTKKVIREQVRAVQDLITRCGCKPTEIDQSKHIKVRFMGPGGIPGLVIVSSSPSDKRGLKNQLSDAIRAAVHAGGKRP